MQFTICELRFTIFEFTGNNVSYYIRLYRRKILRHNRHNALHSVQRPNKNGAALNEVKFETKKGIRF